MDYNKVSEENSINNINMEIRDNTVDLFSPQIQLQK